MVVKVLLLLAVLGLVNLPAASATVQQQQGERCEICHTGMKALTAISIDLTLRGRVCQQSGVWQGGCTDSCCWEWAQHLAECHHPHSQEIPAGEPRYTKGIYAKFTLTVCCKLLYPPTALLLETVQNELHYLQDKLQILQYQNQLQTDRLLEELATLKKYFHPCMDGTILGFKMNSWVFFCFFLWCFFLVRILNILWRFQY